MKLNNVNGCNDISFGDHSILEGDRILPLKSHGQALEEKLCFPGVLIIIIIIVKFPRVKSKVKSKRKAEVVTPRR